MKDKDRGKRTLLARPRARIDLPALKESANVAIATENLHAVQVLYFAAMLEELRMFQVADRLVEMFMQGLLPVGRGQAGEILYRYWKARSDRLTEAERRRV
jgi:hypothetical protein